MANTTDWPAVLRAARKQAKKTQAELGEELGHSQGWAASVESARLRIRLDEAEAWMIACGQSLGSSQDGASLAGLDDEAAHLVRSLAATLRAGLAAEHRLSLSLLLEGWPVGVQSDAQLLAADVARVVEQYNAKKK